MSISARSIVRDVIPAFVAELACATAGRRNPDHGVPGVLVQRAQHAGGVGLAGAGERLDDVDAVPAARAPADHLLLVGCERSVGVRECSVDRGWGDDRAALFGSAGGRLDEALLAVDEVRGRHPAVKGPEHVVATCKPLSTAADGRDPRALIGRLSELPQDGPIIERVGALRQSARPREPIREIAKLHLHLDLGTAAARGSMVWGWV